MKYVNPKKAKHLIEKYLNGKCSGAEERLLESFLDSYQNDSYTGSSFDFKESIEEELWNKIIHKRKTQNHSKIRKLFSQNWVRYAAVFVGLALVLQFYFKQANNQDDSLNINEEMIVLQTANEKNNLNENVNGQITNESGNVIAIQQGDVLKYQKDKNSTDLVYNELKVPKGKTFKLVLSDGTQIHLNADTNIRFPVNFISGKNREVYLDGEAYFEVAKDETNPFIVQAKDLQVQVLGTHFNVSSYDDSIKHAVLVEGSVSVSNHGINTIQKEPMIIKPGQKASLVPDGLDINVVDVEDYISWTQNLLVFNNQSFPEIVKKIERRYNVEIENQYSELDTTRFTGKFKNETILQLMDTFKESANFNYQIKNGKIIITNK
tara:strand:+ start:1095 stop:2228 length:1134 start_codon:yes stop_codon:yes gene_type:complete